MPIYEYRCKSCKTEFERLVFAGDKPEIQCPECKGNDVQKKMSAASFMTGGMKSCATDTPKGFG